MGNAGVERTGVRLVLSNCTEAAQLGEHNKWYDAYGADCTKPGLFANAIRFENPEAAGTDDDPRFLTVYDIVTPDPAVAWPQTAVHQHHLYPDIPGFISIVLAGTYAVAGSVGASGYAATTGMTVVLTDADESAMEPFAGAMMETGIFAGATRFTFVEGFPGEPPRHLVMLGTTGADPLSAYAGARNAAGTMPSQVRHAGSFTLRSSYP